MPTNQTPGRRATQLSRLLHFNVLPRESTVNKWRHQLAMLEKRQNSRSNLKEKLLAGIAAFGSHKEKR